jgi:hypothetical protein
MNNAPSRIQACIDEFLPIIRLMAAGRYAISIGGSHGKRTFDSHSDVDFRLFCDEIVGGPKYWESAAWKDLLQAVENWRAQGIEVDYCWVRTVGEIDKDLNAWLDGQIQPVPRVWTLWGYHLLTDINNQMVIEDPDNLIGAWQQRLAHYPPKLKKALLEKHLESLRYWRTDYHYQNKVTRRDPVFLAGLSARLIHDILQVLFALNETYYVGDGNNLKYVTKFAIKPAEIEERVEEILYPEAGENRLEQQYQMLCRLIDDTLGLAEPLLSGLKAVEQKE